jgi:two-component system OmpR family response regulator
MPETTGTADRILLVEDDACTAMLFKSLLQREGYLVQHCLNGEAALQALWAAKFDAVVLDLMMPGMDGMQVLKKMRSLPDHTQTPVVVMTAARLQMVEEEARKHGAKLYLEKTQSDKLVAGLRAILAERTAAGGASKLRMASS